MKDPQKLSKSSREELRAKIRCLDDTRRLYSYNNEIDKCNEAKEAIKEIEKEYDLTNIYKIDDRELWQYLSVIENSFKELLNYLSPDIYKKNYYTIDIIVINIQLAKNRFEEINKTTKTGEEK